MSENKRDWALILGASSGFGAAIARALAKDGFNIFGVHLDRRSAMADIEALQGGLREAGAEVQYFNVNAAAEAKRDEVLAAIGATLEGTGAQVRVLVHSLAFGTLRPMIADEPKQALDQRALDMTLDVMAHSLVYWAQALVRGGLMRRGGRIFGMTSAGSQTVWKSYGAVSAAKSALESHCRQLAVELAPQGITANALMAGVTDTAALRKIPGHEQMVASATERNPHGRLTTPEDVADAICLLSREGARWISGNTIRVDGAEFVAG